ncbi:hypothetical protein CRE_22469 [Caenorhabditis remanei]|uniref:Uncharacterized protein n=1 Tax=Caenorhabditis remanei TaxID=31234 RepID=E3MED7_CAERE|nr:hypothetical protein CRE_22469 [Caenorhabditis remanei]
MNHQNGDPAAPPDYPLPNFGYMAAPVQQQVLQVIYYYPFPNFPHYAGLPGAQFQLVLVFVPPAAYQVAVLANYQGAQLLAVQYVFLHVQLAAMIPVVPIPGIAPETERFYHINFIYFQFTLY